MAQSVGKKHLEQSSQKCTNILSADPLDCMNECLNIQTGSCQLFVFQTGICYLGHTNVTNGTVPGKLPNATVYFLKGQKFLT